MNALRVYHELPYFLKVAVATARGLQLHAWRYGPETEELVDEALARETWSSAAWRVWTEDRLGRVLWSAARHVPYYREMWARRRGTGFCRSIEDLGNWPVLSKDELRKYPRAFVSDEADPSELLEIHTSGTTGKPLTLWRTRDTNRRWYALCEARLSRWNGASIKDRWGVLGGQLVAQVERRQPPFWVWNAALRQLYLSASHLTATNVPSYVDAIRSHSVTCLEGYSSSLTALAQGIVASDRPLESIQCVVTNAEPLLAHQREVISKAFACAVRESYGTAEIACAGSECEHGRLHQWPEAGTIEILSPEGDPVTDCDAPGRIIATGLLNSTMPLIRYELGDHALPLNLQSCACGRSLPVLGGIEGRCDDLVITKDGRSIGRLDTVFKADFPLLEAQIVQDTLDRFTVFVVPAPGYDDRIAKAIEERLRDRVGDVRVAVTCVSSIARGPNGKFKAVISKAVKTVPYGGRGGHG